jgi:uncharacterized alpha-E superfamily protein
MLSRSAANLYWMSRYMERAESISRLLKACLHSGLAHQKHRTDIVGIPLRVQGIWDDYEQRGIPLTAEAVEQDFLWGEHGSSLKSCLFYARENARAERSRLSAEVWETVNSAWLELPELQASGRPIDEWVREKAFVFHGAVHVTMPRTTARSFVRLGTFVERADQTLRILDVYDELSALEDLSDYYHWLVLLHSVSALDAYQETYGDVPDRTKVAQLLVFNRDIPRSLRYCAERVASLVDSIGGGQKAARAVAQMLVGLQHDGASDWTRTSQKDYLKRLTHEMEVLTGALQADYLEAL